MSEFKRGTLHSGSGDIVNNRKQAVAIAMTKAPMIFFLTIILLEFKIHYEFLIFTFFRYGFWQQKPSLVL